MCLFFSSCSFFQRLLEHAGKHKNDWNSKSISLGSGEDRELLGVAEDQGCRAMPQAVAEDNSKSPEAQ